jgi:ribosomal protein L15
MAHLLKVLPERYAYHEGRQEALFADIGQHGFIRKTTDGTTRYLSLKEFREMIQAGERPQMFQDGACACFA